MNTLYLITKILTYPGAFLKGFWEHVACRMLKLQVTDRGYLRPNELCGHAAHVPAASPAQAFLLSLLPYIPQRILGWIFTMASAPPLLLFNMRGQEENPMLLLQAVALFVGLSLLCNSFPQWEDAKRQWRLFYGKPTPEEEQAAQAYSEALLAAFDAAQEAAEEDAEAETDSDPEVDPEAEAEAEDEDESEADSEAEADPETEDDPEAEDESETEVEIEAEDEADPEADPEAEPAPEEPSDESPALPEMPVLPRFAGTAGKIIFAPCNAYFLAGAWLERYGIPAIAAIVTVAAALIFR